MNQRPANIAHSLYSDNFSGAANNQLEDSERDDQLLHEEGILYVPDFLTNRMGIVNCANEQYGFVTEDPFFEKHLSVTKPSWFQGSQVTLKIKICRQNLSRATITQFLRQIAIFSLLARRELF